MSETPHQDIPPKAAYERDPYPKMILLCIGITVILLLIIGAVMMIDFVVKPQEVEGFEHFDAPSDGAARLDSAPTPPLRAYFEPASPVGLHQRGWIV